jgi:phosphoglycerate dehydrogenase-like enzyme
MPQSYDAVLRGDNPDELSEEVTGSSATRINWARVPNLASLNDKTVGILGFGEIGASYARLLAPFCCRTLAYRRRGLTPSQEAFYGVSAALLDEILTESDVVVSFVPYSPSSAKMLGEAEFKRMKASAYFVNCGRGNTVDEGALIEALRTGRIAGAGLDVFSNEPLPAMSPLKGLKNVSLTPHSAGGTPGWTDTFVRIAANLRRVEAGEPVVIAMRAGDYQPG